MIRFLRQFDPQSIRLVIFDLDGTLIDSRLDLIHSVNATLRHFGRPELEGTVIASYVGDGAPTLVRRALANGNESQVVDEEFFKSALEYFLGYYRLHKLDHTTVYKGIPEALTAIVRGEDGAAAKVKAPTAAKGSARVMAVLSNKPVRPSQDIVQALGLGDFFIRVYGGNSFATKKPDPFGVQTLLEETGISQQQTLMIGDSSIDIQTGRNAGIWACGVTYGFSPHSLEIVKPDVLVESPKELGELFAPNE